MSEKIEFNISFESSLQKWRRTLTSIVGTSVMISIGIYAGSSAMQWAGFILFWLAIISMMPVPRLKTTSIAEARKRLDEIERQQAKS